MHISIDGDDLQTGLVALVVALAEIVKETLKLQALRRLEAGRLSDEELDRLGMALNDLDEAFEKMKIDLGVREAVSSGARWPRSRRRRPGRQPREIGGTMTEPLVDLGPMGSRLTLDRPPSSTPSPATCTRSSPAGAVELANLRAVGLDGCPVRVVVEGRIGALVHDCPPHPYDSGGEAAEAEWVLAHHAVLQLAMATYGSVLPMTFNTIVAATDGKSADENLRDWLAAERASLEARVDAMAGKAEFGLQVSYTPAAVLRRVAEEVPEVMRLEEEARTASAGACLPHPAAAGAGDPARAGATRRCALHGGVRRRSVVLRERHGGEGEARRERRADGGESQLPGGQ